MKNPLLTIDDFLFDRVLNPLMWFFEYHTGWNKFTVSRFLVMVSFVFFVVLYVNEERYSSALVYGLLGGSWFIILGRVESMEKPGTRSIYRLPATVALRYLLALSIPVALYVHHLDQPQPFLEEVFSCLGVLVLFLLGCDSLPPKWTPRIFGRTRKTGHA